MDSDCAAEWNAACTELTLSRPQFKARSFVPTGERRYASPDALCRLRIPITAERWDGIPMQSMGTSWRGRFVRDA
jgi:hypothetical protein